MRQNNQAPTDTGLAGFVAEASLQALCGHSCICCGVLLTDGRRTRLCNECFWALTASTSGDGNRIVCRVHDRRVYTEDAQL